MDRIQLKAEERIILGKKVKLLRKEGILPGHVFGESKETEHVSVKASDFMQVFHQAGETGLIDLKIGDEKIRPVLIREVQHEPIRGDILNISFYQVNLSQKVTVPVPIVLKGDEPESVHAGEAVVLQTVNELQVEALPTDLVENIEVDITPLKNIDDAITVSRLNYDRSKLTIHAEPEEIVVKLAPAVTEEMKRLLEEQAAEAAAAAAEQAAQEGVEAPAEGEEVVEGEEGPVEGEGAEGEASAESGEAKKEGGEEKKEES